VDECKYLNKFFPANIELDTVSVEDEFNDILLIPCCLVNDAKAAER
jgi:hypothetical protein